GSLLRLGARGHRSKATGGGDRRHEPQADHLLRRKHCYSTPLHERPSMYPAFAGSGKPRPRPADPCMSSSSAQRRSALGAQPQRAAGTSKRLGASGPRFVVVSKRTYYSRFVEEERDPHVLRLIKRKDPTVA